MQVRSEQYYNISLPCHGVYGRNCGRGGGLGRTFPLPPVGTQEGDHSQIIYQKAFGSS